MGKPLFALGLVAVVALGVPPGIGVATTGSQRSITISTVAPGLTLTKIDDPAGPYQVRVLTMDPSTPLTFDIATAGGAMGTYARTSRIAASHGALAAVNGDFTVSPGRPLHPLAVDGTLRELGLQKGASFAIRQDEAGSYVGRERVVVKGRNLTLRTNFPVRGYNTGDPTANNLVAYTPYGGAGFEPPPDACSVRLERAGRLHWGPQTVGVSREWRVVRRRCGPAAMGMRAGTVVLSSSRSGTGSRTLKAMKRGQLVRLTWSVGLADVMESVGGMPLLIKKGASVAPSGCGSYFCSRNPRTAVGVTADGKVMLAVVDGRMKSSVGMTLSGWANYLIGLGAVYAVNLDGGGGSTMWVDGEGVVNQPSDRAGERPVTNAVLILPGADDGEPTPLPFGRGPTRGEHRTSGRPAIPTQFPPIANRVMAAALADPGSTGGLMDALVGGYLGPTSLPRGFARMARVFRSSLRP